MNEETTQDDPRRRLKAIWFHQDSFVELFHMWRSQDRVSLPYITVPRDAIVVAVEYSAIRQSFLIIMEHESFEPHEPGCEIFVDPTASLCVVTVPVEAKELVDV